jgi:hypothetical protein
MMEFWDTLWQLIVNLATLAGLVLGLAQHWLLLIVWVVWWLFAVDGRQARAVLARGAWAPAVLILLVAAFVWSRIAPTAEANLWWQLGVVSGLAALALLCGWLQGVLGIVPAPVLVEPVVPHGPGHEHPVGTFHGHEAAHSDDRHVEHTH